MHVKKLQAMYAMKYVNLNCIIYFVAMMDYKTIYSTSRALNCSTATVSLMLKRFCSYFSEPLFVREGGHLEPTSYAFTIYFQLDSFIKNISSLMSKGGDHGENNDNNN
ncbi:helix-turn-helix domain-containing protein [Enterobacter sp. UPMP2060]